MVNPFANVKKFLSAHVNRKEVARTKALIGRAGSAIKTYGAGGSRFNDPKVRQFFRQAGTAILPAGRIGGATARGVSRLGSGLRNLGARALGNPLAGRTIPQFLRTRAGQALGVGSFIGAVNVASGGAIGAKTFAQSVLASAINPIGALVGTGIREGRELVNTLAEIPSQVLPRKYPDVPDFVPEFTGGTNIFNFPEFQTPSVPSFQGSFSSPSASLGAPSVSVGGGGIPPELAILLLGGAGALGYGLGRRRRRKGKRKRYKARKRR